MMKTSKRIVISLVLAVVTLLAIVGMVWTLQFIDNISKTLLYVVTGALLLSALFLFFYKDLDRMIYEDKDDDDEDDEEPEGIELGTINPNLHCCDYRITKDEKDLQPSERRLIDEWDELDTRLLKLDNLLKTTNVLSDVQPVEKRIKRLALLMTQKKTMHMYFSALTMRLQDLGLIETTKQTHP